MSSAERLGRMISPVNGRPGANGESEAPDPTVLRDFEEVFFFFFLFLPLPLPAPRFPSMPTRYCKLFGADISTQALARYSRFPSTWLYLAICFCFLSRNKTFHHRGNLRQQLGRTSYRRRIRCTYRTQRARAYILRLKFE